MLIVTAPQDGARDRTRWTTKNESQFYSSIQDSYEFLRGLGIAIALLLPFFAISKIVGHYGIALAE